MNSLLNAIRHHFTNRFIRIWRTPEGEIIGFRAMGRHGNWPVVVSYDDAAQRLNIRSTLPIRVNARHRDAVADLVTRLTMAEPEGRALEFCEATGLVHHCASHPLTLNVGTTPALLGLIDAALVDVDRHLPAFFAVIGAGLSAHEALDQIARRRRYG